jgi:DNA-binding transcriptional ArsR family regulator
VESSFDDLWDLDRLRLAPGRISTLPNHKPPPHHAPGESFLKGPIPFRWVATACDLRGSGLHVALTMRFLRGRFQRGRDRRWTLEELALGLGVSLKSVRRGLNVAEEAGLLSVSRRPGCKIIAADVTLTEIVGADSDRLPLRGPIPWVWLRPALRLPGSVLQVAMACWLVAGWVNSAEFEFGSSDWGELGLSRFAAQRGLKSLEAARLVAVSRRCGKSSHVELI